MPLASRAFAAVAKEWQLSESEASALLGGGSLPAEELAEETLRRVSLVLGIFGSLNVIFDPDQANAWVRRPNSGPGFNSLPALDRMMSSDSAELEYVRNYLDAIAAGN